MPKPKPATAQKEGPTLKRPVFLSSLSSHGLSTRVQQLEETVTSYRAHATATTRQQIASTSTGRSIPMAMWRRLRGVHRASSSLFFSALLKGRTRRAAPAHHPRLILRLPPASLPLRPRRRAHQPSLQPRPRAAPPGCASALQRQRHPTGPPLHLPDSTPGRATYDERDHGQQLSRPYAAHEPGRDVHYTLPPPKFSHPHLHPHSPVDINGHAHEHDSWRLYAESERSVGAGAAGTGVGAPLKRASRRAAFLLLFRGSPARCVCHSGACVVYGSVLAVRRARLSLAHRRLHSPTFSF
jgi:hypothetical protein